MAIRIVFILLVFTSYGFADQAAFQTEGKVYSIGDLHGDLQSFRKALLAKKLIDKNDHWIGEDAHLVLVGDLVDRGPETRQLMEYVMSLEEKASKSGGKVHTLLGNHEYMVTAGVLEYIHYNDSHVFKDFKNTIYEKGIDGFKNAFKMNSIFAKWFRSRKVAIKINETIFVHAGLEKWAMNYTLDQINEMALDWLKYMQGVGDKPDDKTRWVIENHGPLWTRVFVDYETGKTTLTDSDLVLILNKFRANKIVVGHSTIKAMEDSVSHPTYGGKVILTDTGISSAYNFNISIFEHEKDGGTLAYKIARDFPRVIQTLKTDLKKVQCEALF